MQIAISFVPLDIPESQEMFVSVKNIFSFMPRLALASLFTAYLVSQFNDVHLYEFIKRLFPK